MQVDPSMAKGQLSEARAAVASHLIAAGQAISCSNSIDDVIATLMFWDRDQVSTCFGDLVAPEGKSLARSSKTSWDAQVLNSLAGDFDCLAVEMPTPPRRSYSARVASHLERLIDLPVRSLVLHGFLCGGAVRSLDPRGPHWSFFALRE